MLKFSETPKAVILAGARTLAQQDGLSAISMRNVAKECGISVGSVYNSFSSKDDLVLAVVEDFWHDVGIVLQTRMTPCYTFCDAVENLYNTLAEHFSQFQHGWLEQLTLLSARGRGLGKEKEGHFLEGLVQMLCALLRNEHAVRQDIWTDAFTREALAQFVLDTIFIQLRRNGNIAFLLELLQRAIA